MWIMSSSKQPSAKETLPFEDFDLSLLENETTIQATLKIPLVDDEKSPLEEAHRPLEDQRLQGIDQQNTIAEGQTWRIYLGQEHLPERQVAIKKLKPEKKYLATELLEEALIIGRLNHPNVPPIYQVKFDPEKQPEVVMMKIEGVSFDKILDHQPQTHSQLQQALSILLQVCHAIEFAHAKGYLHRDLKTKNIIVGTFNQVYVMDWGLSINFTETNRQSKKLVGSPGYMATEMLAGDPNILTPATDVFLLGAILHEILTGEFRNQGTTVREALLAALRAEPYHYSQDIPEVLRHLCNWACAKKPKDRPQSVLLFRQNLEAILINWEAINLLQKGQEWLKEYQTRWKIEQTKDIIDDFALYQIALRAKFSFEQSLEIWPNLTQAREHLIETLELIVQQSLQTKEYQRALLLYEESAVHFSEKKDIDNMFEKVLQMREKDERRDSSLSNVKRQLDPSLSQQSRAGLAIVLAIVILVGIIHVILWQVLDITLNIEDNFYFTMSAVIPLWIGLGILYKRLQINTFSRQVFRTLFFNTTTIGVAAYGCWCFETDVHLAYLLYSLISALVWINATPVIRKGKLLGMIGFLTTTIGIFFPNISQLLFLLLISSGGIVIAFDWKRHL